MIQTKQIMNNTNQQLFNIYKNVNSFYHYRKLVSIDEPLSQADFIKIIQKDKYILLNSINFDDCSTNGKIDNNKLEILKKHIHKYNEKSVSRDLTITNILLIYPGTDAESKKANMMNLIIHVRFPRSHIIVITPTKVTTGISKSLQQLSSTEEHKFHEFKTFTYSLLNSVIPEHESIPKYEILNNEQVEKLKKFNFDVNNLPMIYENDPQMIWIGAKENQIVKFTILSEISIESIGYVRVISNL